MPILQHAHARKLRQGRCSGAGRTYHVTTCCHRKHPLFRNLALGQIVADEIHTSDSAGFSKTHAFVVMPDHLHWLFELGEKMTLSEVVRLLKGRSARRINGFRPMHMPVWQRGFHDHAVRKSEALRKTGDYILNNPVRAGLVADFRDHPLWYAAWEIDALDYPA